MKLVRIKVGFLLSLMLLTLPMQGAKAHAGLVSANPQAGSNISFMPEKIELTFTEDLMTLGDKNVNTISLTDPLGADVALTDVSVDGAVLSATIPAGQNPTGKFEVTYSIVSADGHKLSGSYSFTAKSFGDTLQTPEATTTQATNSDSQGDGAIPLPIALAIAVVIGIGGYLVLSKRRRQP
mgnify:CR=1 FL=1|jgi:methionine-rich copper-binding protein CopC